MNGWLSTIVYLPKMKLGSNVQGIDINIAEDGIIRRKISAWIKCQ